MVLLSLLSNPLLLARLEAALAVESSLPCEIRPVAGWSELYRVASHSSADVVVFDPVVDGEFDLMECTAFHEAFPSLVLLPYCAVPLSTRVGLLRLVGLRIHNVLVRDDGDGPLALRLALSESFAHATAGRVLSALEDVTPEDLLPLSRYLLRSAYRPVRPQELARFFCRHPKTLREHLRRAGFPRTEEWIGWARLFHAAQRLGDPGRTVEQVALALSFPSSVALRNQLRRYAGVSPRELVPAGGLEFLLERFRARLRLRSSEGTG
jgi:AraC-like DNA-binding protein